VDSSDEEPVPPLPAQAPPPHDAGSNEFVNVIAPEEPESQKADPPSNDRPSAASQVHVAQRDDCEEVARPKDIAINQPDASSKAVFTDPAVFQEEPQSTVDESAIDHDGPRMPGSYDWAPNAARPHHPNVLAHSWMDLFRNLRLK
jgi:hypothetical protein